MTHPRILVLSVSAGTGHTRAAEALRSCASGEQFGMEAVHLDTLQFVTPLLRFVYTDAYMFMVRHVPALWRHLYRTTNIARLDGLGHTLRRWAERVNSRSMLKEITRQQPDLIICTHFLPAELLSRLLAAGEVKCPVWVQVTDFDLHRMWVHEDIAGYFAPNDEVAFRMREQGIAAERIFVTGIPIMPAFSAPLDRAACARELDMPPAVTTLLLLGGGAGFGSVSAIAERLLKHAENFQIIALAGKDLAMLAALNQLAIRYPGRLVAKGYTGKIERLMACADLVVTKPGGLTTAESLAMGLPMIVIAPIPGQEEHNANFLLEQGVAFKAFDLATLEYRVSYLLTHPSKLAAMRSKASTLARPDAARRALAIALHKAAQ
jgi:processive 1,2-diacylglycerol beta-glucosyltransferase